MGVKGDTALLARGLAVRHTLDIDIYRATTIDQMDRDLRAAARVDLSDWMTFEIGASRSVTAGTSNGLRLPVKAIIGTTPWAQFHVDLVGEGVQMTGQVDQVPSLTPITLPGLDTITYRAYPLVDDVADKRARSSNGTAPDPPPDTRTSSTSSR